MKEIVLSPKKVFVGHSFSPSDLDLVNDIKSFLMYFGLQIDSGERPDARSISEKIKSRLVDCDVFLGLFTRREKLGETGEYSTSPWVSDEKTYAVSLNKSVLLYVEEGVHFNPGLQADYEYIRFSRSHFSEALIKSIPYIFSVISRSSFDSDSIENSLVIDRFEALRLLKDLVNDGLNRQSSEDEQNYSFRNSLCRGMASFALEGDYSALVYLVDFLNEQGYKIEKLSKPLFLRYTIISKESIENERLRLKARMSSDSIYS